MNAKKFPYWFIGGVISLVILFLPLLVLQLYFGWEVLGDSILFDIYKFLNKLPLIFNPPNQIIKLIIAFVGYFLIGAIIGLIYGKIKNK